MFPLIKASMRSADVGHLAEQISKLEIAGIDALHFDIMDGRFGPEISMGQMFIRGLRKYTKLQFDVHLWVEDPDQCIDSFIDAGADCIIIHIEANANVLASLSHLKKIGVAAGLAINISTPVSRMEPFLNLCDEINVMTIPPGSAGQLSEQGVENLRQVAQLASRYAERFVLQADGAVSLKTRDLFVEAGAKALVVGYPIFSQVDFGMAISQLRYGNSFMHSGG